MKLPSSVLILLSRESQEDQKRSESDVGNFRDNFIFANNEKRHIWDVIKSRLWHDLPISVNDKMISPFREDYIFTKLKPSRKFPNLQYRTACADPESFVRGVF